MKTLAKLTLSIIFLTFTCLVIPLSAFAQTEQCDHVNRLLCNEAATKNPENPCKGKAPGDPCTCNFKNRELSCGGFCTTFRNDVVCIIGKEPIKTKQ